jgi:hypothetical protein
MINQIWNLFPRMLEQQINGLLDAAEANPTKAFQLYKICKNENLWKDSFEKFSEHLRAFFALPKAQRSKGVLDSFLESPMDMHIYECFHLNFRTAIVNSRSVSEIASWAHQLMRVGYKKNITVISSDVIAKTLHYITNPPLFEKAHAIEFEDFCSAWKKTVFKLFGKKYDTEFNDILKELNWLNTQLKAADQNPQAHPVIPTYYLTQTEIDWTTAVQKAVEAHLPAPKFPLSRGPQKQRLVDLERAISLYKIVQSTKLPELLHHRENIRATILDRCDRLLREREK